jgi:mannose-6-phosphate isomerase-like protein (cupin superfamily)
MCDRRTYSRRRTGTLAVSRCFLAVDPSPRSAWWTHHEGMEIFTASEYTGDAPWQALSIAQVDGASVRLHWTDQPYHWHVNAGPEVFVVLDGIVEMRVRTGDVESAHELRPGMVFHAEEGDEHVASPIGEARILGIERVGSE